MDKVFLRIVLAGAFGTIALIGGLVLEVTDRASPEWIIGVFFGAAGYIYGHVSANGNHFTRKREG